MRCKRGVLHVRSAWPTCEKCKLPHCQEYKILLLIGVPGIALLKVQATPPARSARSCTDKNVSFQPGINDRYPRGSTPYCTAQLASDRPPTRPTLSGHHHDPGPSCKPTLAQLAWSGKSARTALLAQERMWRQSAALQQPKHLPWPHVHCSPAAQRPPSAPEHLGTYATPFKGLRRFLQQPQPSPARGPLLLQQLQPTSMPVPLCE